MQATRLGAAVAALCLSCSPAVRAQSAAPSDQELTSYLREHWQSPEEYIVGKFKRYDLVIVSEDHRIRHDPELIRDLIPRLYRAGVRNLGYEFARYSDQPDIDRLVTAPTYDENLARRLLFDMFVGWGYKEYLDVLRAAWRLNHSLPASAPRFRVVGLGATADWPSARENMSEQEMTSVVWGGVAPDAQMANAAIREFLDKGQKALIYCGRHHGFTRYRQPTYDYGNARFTGFRESRMGNILYARAPDRVFNIMLHAPWMSKRSPNGTVLPVNGRIDRVMAQFRDQRVGFDATGSPFGRLTDDRTFYAAGYDDFTLATITDGYVFQKQVDRYEGVTVDDRFITAGNVEEAIRNIPNVRARRPQTPRELLDDMRRDADWKFRSRVLEDWAAPAQTQPLEAFLRTRALPPEEYVLSKFRTHDLVLIGEPHWVQQHVNFVRGMIPILQRHGIHTLAIEFARRVDQPLIDSLLAAPTYNEPLARRVMLQALPTWGYQEYADLYREAWELNHHLSRGARRFRILALNNAPRWNIIKTDDEFNDWRIRYAATRGEGEDLWARLLIDSVLSRHEKALVYTGAHHAFTRYAQPIVDSTGRLIRTTDERFGQALYRAVPNRVFMVLFNAPLAGPETYDSGWVLPAHGALERVVREFDPQHQRLGFDLIGTPAGALVSDNTVYRKGHEPLTLEKLADGFIVLGPIADYKPVHAIPDFINAGNIEEARGHISRPSERAKSIQDLNHDTSDALAIVGIWSRVKE